MNGILHKRILLWVLAPFVFAFSAVLFISSSAFAANIDPDFTNFISDQRGEPASDQQANTLYNYLTAGSFASVCQKDSSYFANAVNSRDASESWASFESWLNDGAESLSRDWQTKSNTLLQLMNGEVGGDMSLEFKENPDGSISEGWCSYTIRMADQAKIPITGKAVVVDNAAIAKTSGISAIATNCPAEFSTGSSNIISTGTQITTFLGDLSDNDYKTIVAPLVTDIKGGGPGATACSTLVANLKTQIDAKVAAYCKANASDAKCEAIVAGAGVDGVSSSCVIEGVGWIICPVMNFTAGIVDAAYGFVALLLEVQPLLTTGETAGIFNAWTVMRNIANLAFVIVFLFIIFSQLTSMGVSNYGVKKMLPRLVIGAILVNVSFWICAIGVDLSNIIGGSMLNVFNVIGDSIPAKENINIADSGEGWTGIVGAVLAGTVAVGIVYYVTLSALIPALLAVVVAIITVFLVLTLRQALIILLIVIAPLAFVAYLLPNTEDWFTKWRKFFTTLLLMYPIIAAIFGASALASVIIMNSSDNPVIQIMGACIAIVPLALTPLVMKTAGGVLNRFAGFVNNTERGPIDRLKKVGAAYHDTRVNARNARALNGERQLGRGSFVKWRARRGAIASGAQAESNRAKTEYVANTIQDNQKFQNAVAGGNSSIIPGTNIGGKAATGEAQQRALASAISTEAKLQADEIQAAQVVVKSAQLSTAQQRALSEGLAVTADNGLKLDGSSTAVKAAAIRGVVESNDVLQINKLWDTARTWHDEEGNKLREVFADSLQSSSARPAYIGQGAIAQLRASSSAEGGKIHADSASIIESALVANAYSPDKVASADKDELAAVDAVRRASTTLKPEVDAQFVTNVTTALTDGLIRTRVGKNRENLERIQSGIEIPPLK